MANMAQFTAIQNNGKSKQKSILDYFRPNNSRSLNAESSESDVQFIKQVFPSVVNRIKTKCRKESIVDSNDKIKKFKTKSYEELHVKSNVKIKKLKKESCDELNVESNEKINVSCDQFIDANQYLEVNFYVNEDSDYQTLDTSEAQNIIAIKGSYIFDNFRHMIDCVLNDRRYLDLFDASDWKVIESFTSFTDSSQFLFMRLFVRKRQWIRKKSIKYPEISDNLQPFIGELVDNGFLNTSSHFDELIDGLNVLDSSELKYIARSLNGIKINGSLTKKNINESIIKYVNTCRSVNNNHSKNFISNLVLDKIKVLLKDNCFKLDDKKCDVFERMFLLNYSPELCESNYEFAFGNEFFKLLKVETGKEAYPQYCINRTSIIYKTREDLASYVNACKLENNILTAIEKRDYNIVINNYANKAENFYNQIKDGLGNNDGLLPLFLRRYTAGHAYIRCLSHCVNIFEQKKNYSEAVRLLRHVLLSQNVYCNDYRGRWFERLALNLEKHLKETISALNVIKEALCDPFVRTSHRLSIYIRGKNLLKSLKSVPDIGFVIPEYECLKYPEKTIFASTVKYSISDRKNIFQITDYNGDVNVMPVEDIVIDHYRKDGFNGIHSEGVVYHAIFGLLFWDIIYLDNTSVNDSFRFSCQRLPLDFNNDEFYIRRKTLIHSQLENIKKYDETEISDVLDKMWNRNIGTQSLINWENLDLNKVKEIAVCLGSDVISGICERLVKDFRHTRSGFPDLIVWNYSNKCIKVIEVKGPNDRASTKQVLWLLFLKSLGIEVEVCHVKVKKRV